MQIHIWGSQGKWYVFCNVLTVIPIFLNFRIIYISWRVPADADIHSVSRKPSFDSIKRQVHLPIRHSSPTYEWRSWWGYLLKSQLLFFSVLFHKSLLCSTIRAEHEPRKSPDGQVGIWSVHVGSLGSAPFSSQFSVQSSNVCAGRDNWNNCWGGREGEIAGNELDRHWWNSWYVLNESSDLDKNMFCSDLEALKNLLKGTVDSYPSEHYCNMKNSVSTSSRVHQVRLSRFQIFAEEKETADMLVSLSRQSSDSGRGTLSTSADTQPSTPQPQLDASVENPLAAMNLNREE